MNIQALSDLIGWARLSFAQSDCLRPVLSVELGAVMPSADIRRFLEAIGHHPRALHLSYATAKPNLKSMPQDLSAVNEEAILFNG